MRLLKPTLVSLLLFFFQAYGLCQEIPNDGFEDWEVINSWTETPVGWQTQNGQLIQNTVRDSFPNSGDWAMRVYPIPSGVGEFGYAESTIELTEAPNSLDFFAKWQKTISTSVYVEVYFMYDDAIVYNDLWVADQDTSEWGQVSLPINLDGIPITSAEVKVVVFIRDLLPGEGWLAVDDMSFGFVSAIQEIETTSLPIGPNPCDKELIINTYGLSLDENMVVYDSTGHLIDVGKIKSTFNTSQLHNGTYILQIGEGENLKKEKFLVQH